MAKFCLLSLVLVKVRPPGIFRRLLVTGMVPGFKIFPFFLVNQEFKALVTGLPKNFLVEPGILGINQEVNQEVPRQV